MMTDLQALSNSHTSAFYKSGVPEKGTVGSPRLGQADRIGLRAYRHLVCVWLKHHSIRLTFACHVVAA